MLAVPLIPFGLAALIGLVEEGPLSEFEADPAGSALGLLVIAGLLTWGGHELKQAVREYRARPLFPDGLEFTGDYCRVWDRFQGSTRYLLTDISVNTWPALSLGGHRQHVVVRVPGPSGSDEKREVDVSFFGDNSEEIANELYHRIDRAVRDEVYKSIVRDTGKSLHEWIEIARQKKIDDLQLLALELRRDLNYHQAVVVARRALK